MKFIEAYDYFSGIWESNSTFRFYHTKKNHLNKILQLCNDDEIELKYFCLFHDIIFNPYSNSNEEDSAKYFYSYKELFDDLINKDIVIDMILATKKHILTNNFLINKAIEMDLNVLNGSLYSLIEYENLILKNIKDMI